MKKNITALVFSFLVIFCLSFLFAFTSNAREDEEINLPEEEGIYNVPNHPKLKLRVFVYHDAKNSSPKPTPAPPTSQVCSYEEFPSIYEPGLIGWHLKNGTTTYRLNQNSVPSTVGPERFQNLAQQSFNTWWSGTDVNQSVSFQEGPNTSISRAVLDGQNIITWGRTSGSALAVTYTWYYPDTGIVAENDTIFNLKFPWAWSDSDTCAYQNFYDAQDILTHELGHWVGLLDEYTANFVNNTMYGYGSKTEVKKNTLTSGDINAVNRIY